VASEAAMEEEEEEEEEEDSRRWPADSQKKKIAWGTNLDVDRKRGREEGGDMVADRQGSYTLSEIHIMLRWIETK
jgi:hypothetical protein